MTKLPSNHQSVFITGGALRIGAAIARLFHRTGYRVFLHYHSSKASALAIQSELNKLRIDSCILIHGNLNDLTQVNSMVEQVKQITSELHVLINNASIFKQTPWGETTLEQWQSTMMCNAQAPFFLIQGLLSELKSARGSVINLIDIHAHRGLENHSVYCASKSVLMSLTMSLAKDYGDHIRSNGIAPGAILWPDNESSLSDNQQKEILDKIPQKKLGTVNDIASTALFLAQSSYINGQIINVDGGRTLHA